MFAVFFSVFATIFRWLATSGFLKFATFGVAMFFFNGLVSLLLSLLPDWFNSTSLQQGQSGFTAGMWYFIDLFELQAGISLLLSALTTRFLIRRIPFLN